MCRRGRPCVSTLALVALGLSGLSAVADDPAAKRPPDDGLVWLSDHRTGMLVAYTPAGKKDREIDPRVQLSSRVLGLTADGQQLLYAAKTGEFPKEDVSGLTLHVRPLYDPAGWTDTRIEVQHRRESPVLPSPDGRLVARNRTVYPDPTKPPLYRFATDVVELATGKSLELNVPENTVAVGWFPDGRSVLAHWTDPADRPPMTVPKTRLLRAPIGGGEPTVLVEDAPFTAGGVSPDGKAVLGAGYGTYSEREQRAPYGIVTLDLESKKWAPVAFPADATFATGVWSPDGKRIAYHGIHGKPDPRSAGLPRVTRVSVTVCDRDGGNPRTIFEVKGDEALGSVSLVGWYPAGR